MTGRVAFKGPKDEVERNARLWNVFLGREFKKTDRIVEVRDIPQLEEFLKYKVDPRYRNKGQCYSECGHFVAQDLDNDDLVLVHGTHRNPDGLVIPHAWVELNGYAMDVSNNVAAPIDRWYEAGNKPIKKYAPKEAARMMLKTGHYGPWDAKSLKLGDEARRKVGLK